MKDEIILNAIEQCVEIIKIEGIARLRAQGHEMTGRGIKSFQTKVEKLGIEFSGIGFGEQYLMAQETGIKKQNYRISPQLILNLTEWVKDRGIKGFMKNGNPYTNEEIAGRIAFNAKYITGMHSLNGHTEPSKQGWLSDTINDNKTKINTIIDGAGYKYFDSMISTLIEEHNRNNKI